MSDVNPTPEVTPTLKEMLLAATKDLLYPSESDEPFEYIEWNLPLDKPIDKTQIVGFIKDPNAKIKTWNLTDFFKIPITEKDWFDDYQKKQVVLFKNLLNILQENITDIQVFRVGRVEIEVYIIGKTKDTWAGLKTMLVES